MQTKKPPLFTPVPVAVHMWFADGAGWAYHPDLSGQVIDEILMHVTQFLNSSDSEKKFGIKCPLGVLVGKKLPQAHCEDPNAADRSPHVLRVALIGQIVQDALATADDPSHNRLYAEVYRQLGALPTPKKKGECASLVVWADADAVRVSQEELTENYRAKCEKYRSEMQAENEAREELTEKLRQQKQENKDLRREMKEELSTKTTRTQFWIGLTLIVLLSAILGSLATHFGAPYLRNDADVEKRKEISKEPLRKDQPKNSDDPKTRKTE